MSVPALPVHVRRDLELGDQPLQIGRLAACQPADRVDVGEQRLSDGVVRPRLQHLRCYRPNLGIGLCRRHQPRLHLAQVPGRQLNLRFDEAGIDQQRTLQQVLGG